MRTLLASLLLVVSGFAGAHPVPCPRCGLKVVPSTSTQDNETVLRFGNKRIEYRCVFCALADAERYAGDVFVYAPSETRGDPVVLARQAGLWRAVRVSGDGLVPETGVVFLCAFDAHARCATLARAFHSAKGFDAYAPKGKDARPLDLAGMLAKVGAK